MRIIAGLYKGRIVKMPPKGVRPTQDRVRESIFNVIREIVPGSSVLDLYAGSGAFGIEAVSRGANSCTFIDNDSTSISVIRSNVGTLIDDTKITQVFKKDALRAIDGFGHSGTKFDIVFIDPPYYKEFTKNTLLKIDACDILSKRGFVVSEHFVKDELPTDLTSIQCFKTNKYGDTIVSFYRKIK